MRSGEFEEVWRKDYCNEATQLIIYKAEAMILQAKTKISEQRACAVFAEQRCAEETLNEMGGFDAGYFLFIFFAMI